MTVITWSDINSTQLNVVLQGKTFLDGLVLDGLTSITSLSPALDSVVNISTGVSVENMPALTDMSIPSVTSIGGGMRITNNTQLLAISLPNVTSISGDMYVFSNARVMTTSFSSLIAVNGSLTMQSVAGLSASGISVGFPNLQCVGAQFTLLTFSWSGSTALSSLILTRLQSVGALYLRQTQLLSVELPALVRVGGSAYLYDMPRVQNLSFPVLTAVSGQLTVSSMASLTNLCQMALQESGYSTDQAVCAPRLYHVRLASFHSLTGD